MDSHHNGSLAKDSIEFLLALLGFISSVQAMGSVKGIFILDCKREWSREQLLSPG